MHVKNNSPIVAAILKAVKDLSQCEMLLVVFKGKKTLFSNPRGEDRRGHKGRIYQSIANWQTFINTIQIAMDPRWQATGIRENFTEQFRYWVPRMIK